MTHVLDNQFYDRPVADVARDLLGELLCRRSRTGLTIGRIVETEAYLAQHDAASHTSKGLSRRNASMFGPPGCAYVYTIHARQCVNVVTEGPGTGSAVLIRAVEPLAGLEYMQRRRRTDKKRDLCRGPARLCEAFAIGRSLDGWNLTKGERLWITGAGEKPDFDVAVSSRIGVTSAADLQLRFFLIGNRFVSGTDRFNATGSVISSRRPLEACQ